MLKKTAYGAAIAGLMGTSAFAQTMLDASASTDLNLRAGPAPSAEILTVIPAEGGISAY